MAIQQTYTMIKPDGVRNKHVGEIVNRFERAGLAIERMELGMVTPEQAKANYAVLRRAYRVHNLGPSREDGRVRRGRRQEVPLADGRYQPA